MKDERSDRHDNKSNENQTQRKRGMERRGRGEEHAIWGSGLVACDREGGRMGMKE